MTQQTTGLVVNVDIGSDSQRRVENMQRALDGLTNAGDNSAASVQNVGQSTQQATSGLSSLGTATRTALNNLLSFGRGAGTASNSANSLGSSAAGAAGGVNHLGTAAGSATSNVASLGTSTNSTTPVVISLGAAGNTAAAGVSNLNGGVTQIIINLNHAQNSFNSATTAVNNHAGAVNSLNNANSGLVIDLPEIAKKLKVAATAVAAYVTSFAAGGAALAAFVASQADVANEINRIARVAGTSTDEIQKMTVGATAIGIEMDKFGDIMKDTNDKIGDYLSTGGGELQDFFKLVAPQIGLTAESLRGLSADQSLQKIYSAMESAGLSAKEMTFYMEGVADEASALIPLLKNGGAGFKLWYEEAERAGAVMDQDVIKKLLEAKTAVERLSLSYGGFKTQIAAEFAPMMTELAEMFTKDKELKDKATEALKTLVDGMKLAVITGIAFATTIGAVGRGLGGLIAIYKEFYSFNFMGAWEISKQLPRDIADSFDTSFQLMRSISNLGNGAASAQNEALTKTIAAQNVYNQALDSTNEKLLALTGNTAKAGKNGSVHLDVRYSKKDSRYGKQVTEADLNKLLLDGKPVRQSGFSQSSNYGWRMINGKKDFHEGFDFATPMNTKVSTKVPVKSVRSLNNMANGGGYVTEVEFKDGTVLNLLHLSPKSVELANQYNASNVNVAGYGKTGAQIQAGIDAAKTAAEEARKAQESLNRERLAELTKARENIMREYLKADARTIESRFGVPMGLLAAIANKESMGDVRARHKDKDGQESYGLTQIRTPTARELAAKMKAAGYSGFDKPTLDFSANDIRLDAKKNFEMTAFMLNELYKKFGDWTKVVAAYNAGAGGVAKRGVFNKGYVNDVNDFHTYYRHAVNTGDMGISGSTEVYQEAANAASDFIAQQLQIQKDQAEKLMLEASSGLDKINKAYTEKLKEIDENTVLGDSEKKAAKDNAERNFKSQTTQYYNNLNAATRDAMSGFLTANEAIIQDTKTKIENLTIQNPDLARPENKAALDSAVTALEKQRDLRLAINKLANDSRLLDAKRDFMKPSDYENELTKIKQASIKLSNSDTKDLDLESEKARHELVIKNIQNETASKLASLNLYKMSEEEAINAAADARLSAISQYSETYTAEKEAIEFNRNKDISLLRFKNTEQKNFIDTVYKKELDLMVNNHTQRLAMSREAGKLEIDNLNARFDLERQRLEAESGKPITAAQKSYLNAQKAQELNDMMNTTFNSYSGTYANEYLDADAQLAKDLALMTKAKDARIAIAQEEGAALADIEAQTANQIDTIQKAAFLKKQQMMLSNFSSVFSSITALTKSFVGEQSKTYRVMFFAEKAFNIASAVLNGWGALSKAWNSAPFPGNLTAVAMTAAQTGVIQAAISAIQPQGFQTGGYTGNYGLSQIAGVVHGQEYVLNAQATKNIGVSTLNALNSGAKLASQYNVNIYNTGSAKVRTEFDGSDLNVYVDEAVDRKFSQLSNPSSFPSRALKRNTTAKTELV